MSMQNRIRRIERIEKRLDQHGQGKYLTIWDESIILHWPELGAWALGYTEERPDCWPSEDREASLRRQGYTVPTRGELRQQFEDLLELRRQYAEAVPEAGLWCPVGEESDELGIEQVKEMLRTIP